MLQVSISSTLSGKLSVKHPIHCVLCREDGAILTRKPGYFVHYKPYEIPHSWSFGANAKGYRLISIGGKTYRVHRIICEAFHDNPESKPTVDHIDRNPSNNRADNLRWATSKEQRDNSSAVINRLPYSVRQCENRPVYDKEYRADHLDEKREYDKQYRKRNAEHIKAVQKQYRETHREQLNARMRKYRAEHPEYFKELESRRRSRRKPIA